MYILSSKLENMQCSVAALMLRQAEKAFWRFGDNVSHFHGSIEIFELKRNLVKNKDNSQSQPINISN